ncbi:sensor histidine kinase [Aeromicrobium sp.]|uniref:sensor histidine kinase n=1 Tax=Aeromicrobium sp. TaxID=1871063 RepID=UPI002FCC86A9
MPIKQVDVLVAGSLVALGFVQLVSAPPDHPQIAALLTLGMTMPLLVRRTLPLPVVVVSAGAATGYAFAIEPTPPFAGFLALIVMAYTVGRFSGSLATVAGLACIAAAVIGTGVTQPTAPFEWIYPIVYFAGGFAVGRFVRARSARSAVETDTRVWDAVVEERGRIARELHDVVAHGLGVMVLHAEAADELLSSDPEAARRSLWQVQRSGREAIGELTLLLGLLRDVDPREIRGPQPMLAQLPDLVREFENSGREVALTVDGDLNAVPTGIQLTVYRVIQEALTNATKHSHARCVEVSVAAGDRQVVATIADNGPVRSGAEGARHGLVGMRERAALYGGNVDAARAGSGFRVRLMVPLP